MARKSPPTRRRTAATRSKPRPAAKRRASRGKRAAPKRARQPKRARPTARKAKPAKAATSLKRAKPAKPAKRARPAARTKPVKPTTRRATPAAVSKRPRTHRPFPEIDERVPVGPPSTLQRQRRVLSEDERLEQGPVLPDERMVSAARTGHDELRMNIALHTESSPVLTAGDVDAKWEDAYSVGDEAPGGDNPTPDQQRVDDIGRALGVNYQDNQELQGGDELTDRDKHRWELDPASSDDWPHDK